MKINAWSAVNKSDDLESVLITYDPDVSILRETWLQYDIPDWTVIPSSHEIVRHDRGARGGGVAIVLKKGLDFKVLSHDTCIEMT